jgi:hypothetical protein
MKKYFCFFLLFGIFIYTNNFSQEKTDIVNHFEDIQNDSLKEYYFKKWQLKLGYSLNNKNIFNIEASNIFRISNLFALSLDYRLYSFISITPSLVTRPIDIQKDFSISIKGGIGIMGLPVPVIIYGLDISTEFGVIFRYRLNEKCNILLEYKQIHKNSLYESFNSLFNGPSINHFPLRFISVGVEF